MSGNITYQKCGFVFADIENRRKALETLDGSERADGVAVRAENDSSDFSGKLGFTLKIGNREKNPPCKEADLSALSHNERCRKMAKNSLRRNQKLLDMMINSIYTNSKSF